MTPGGEAVDPVINPEQALDHAESIRDEAEPEDVVAAEREGLGRSNLAVRRGGRAWSRRRTVALIAAILAVAAILFGLYVLRSPYNRAPERHGAEART